MSVPKVKCPSCGTEWAGPVVFCGECGAAITTPPAAGPADRVARVPPAPPPAATDAAPPAAKPAKPAAPTKPLFDTKPAAAKPAAPTKPLLDAKPADARPSDPARSSRPSDLEARRTVVGMPAAFEPTKPARRDTSPGGKKGRKGSLAIPADPTTPDETEKLLEALDAGFDTITRPSEVPVVPITPSIVPDLPVTSGPQAAPHSGPAEPGQGAALVAPVQVSEPAQSPALAEPAQSRVPDVTANAELADLASSLGEMLGEGVAAPSSDGPSIEVTAALPFVDEATRRAQHESDMAEVRALFSEMAAGHARPLRDFMIEVSWGEPTREWLDIAVPATSALRRAAEALEMTALTAALDGFTAALELTAGEAAIGRDAKDLLLGAYAKLAELLPSAFALEGERGRREPIIVRALLLQVPGVQKVALDKIYAAGLNSLAMLYAAGPRELAETTGLDEDVAARVHERFQRYRQEVAAVDPGQDRAAERAELEALLGELSRAHEDHERLAKSWASDAAAGRARARTLRNDVMLRIDVLLARVGEVDRQKALEKVPFAQKIRDLTAYLDEAKRRAARP